MREPGYEDFAALWNEPEDSERQAFEKMARKARLQGRLHAYGDAFVVIMIVGLSLAGVLLKPSGVMLIFGMVMAVTSIVITWQRRKIRQMTKTLDTSDRRAFVRSSVENAQANLRRVTLSLIVFPTGLPVAILFKIAWRHGGHIEHPLIELAHWATSIRGMITLPVFFLLGGLTIRSRLKIKAELRRLEALEAAYQDEAENDRRDSV